MIASIKHEVPGEFNAQLLGVSSKIQEIKEAEKKHYDTLRAQQEQVIPKQRAKVEEVIETLDDGIKTLQVETKE